MNKILKVIKNKTKKISNIEWMVLIIVVVSTVAMVKFYGRSPNYKTFRIQVVGKNWNDSFVSYRGFKPPIWFSKKINVGDQIKSINGKLTAEITKVDEYRRGDPSTDLFLNIKLRGETNTNTGIFSYLGNPVYVGGPIELEFPEMIITGQVVDEGVSSVGYPEKQIIITGRVFSAEPWIIENIYQNQKVINLKTGKAMAEIIEYNTEPATINYASLDQQNNRVNFTNVPGSKDIILKIKVTLQHINNEWMYLERQTAKINEFLWLDFEEITLPVVIQSVYDFTEKTQGSLDLPSNNM
ncbi:hypothetical protein ACFL1M_04455 [Patescibacteria group bacterium]